MEEAHKNCINSDAVFECMWMSEPILQGKACNVNSILC